MLEHGRFEVWTDSNIVYAALFGSTNEELMTHFGDELKLAAGKLETRHWGHIVWLENWQLGTPETEPVVQDLTRWCIDNGLIRAAQIFSPSTIKRFQLDKMVKAQEGLFIRQQFKSTSEAVQWMRSEGFEVNESALRLLGA